MKYEIPQFRDFELIRINEFIAYGLNRKKIAEKYSLKPPTFGRWFSQKYKIPFTAYKKMIKQSLKDMTYE